MFHNNESEFSVFSKFALAVLAECLDFKNVLANLGT